MCQMFTSVFDAMLVPQSEYDSVRLLEVISVDQCVDIGVPL